MTQPEAENDAEAGGETGAGTDAETTGRHGRFRYPRHDRFIGASLARYGEYSEAEFNVLRHLFKPGTVVVEAGANIGALTVPIARLAGPRGRVIAFEPQAAVRRLLEANLALNDIGNTEVRGEAVGDRPGIARIPVPDYAATGNFGGIALAEEGEEVPLVRLDDVITAPRLQLLKLDIEGMELAALTGAARLIARDRPLIYLENNPGPGSAPLISAVMEMGYQAYWDLPPLYNPDNYRGEAENIFGRIVSINMLCIPAERGTTLPDPITSADARPGPGF
ncbi:MAG: FkbM family methyltransferase [Pseudomonadota bacterium]